MRFELEHTFRFLKQTFGWTTPWVHRPEQADRWTWLVVAAFTQLRLARSCVNDRRLPAVEEALRSGSSNTDPGHRVVSALCRSLPRPQSHRTLRALARKAQRVPLGPGETLPGRQEDRLRIHEDGERGSFTMDIKPIAKLFVVKTQAKANNK